MLYATTIIYQGFLDAKLTEGDKQVIVASEQIRYFMNYLHLVNLISLYIIAGATPFAIFFYVEGKNKKKKIKLLEKEKAFTL